MNIGISTNKWLAISEGWTPSMRAYAFDLLTWAWESRSPLPDNPVTLARLARADDRRSFAAAWERLSAPNGRGIFVLTEYGYICPLQDEARGVREQKSRAGKASAAARRIDLNPRPPAHFVTGLSTQQRVPTQIEQPPPPAPAIEPFDPADVPFTEPETRPEILPTPRALGIFSGSVDTAALTIAQTVLRGAGPVTWDQWRDSMASLIGTLYGRLSPKECEGAVDQTELTYRLWDESFLGSYRDRFTTTAATIEAAPISRSTTDRL